MAEEVDRSREMAGEADGMVGGPGVVATKSQARGAVFGGLLGAIVGGILGLIVGLLVDLPLVIAIVGAVAGGVFGMVAGGGQNPKQKLGGGSEGDI